MYSCGRPAACHPDDSASPYLIVACHFHVFLDALRWVDADSAVNEHEAF